MANRNDMRSDKERLAVLEKSTDDHENDIRDLESSVRGLTLEINKTGNELKEELAKTRQRMEKSISFLGGVAFAFGLFGGLVGTALTLFIEYITRISHP